MAADESRRPFLCEVQLREMQTGCAARRIWPGLGLLVGPSCGMIWVGCNEVEVFRIKNRLCRVDAYEAAQKAQVARWSKTRLLDESQYEYEKPHPLAGRWPHWPPFAAGPHPLQAPLDNARALPRASVPLAGFAGKRCAFPQLRTPNGVRTHARKTKARGAHGSSRSCSRVGHQGFEPWALGLKVPCSAS